MTCGIKHGIQQQQAFFLIDQHGYIDMKRTFIRNRNLMVSFAVAAFLVSTTTTSDVIPDTNSEESVSQQGQYNPQDTEQNSPQSTKPFTHPLALEAVRIVPINAEQGTDVITVEKGAIIHLAVQLISQNKAEMTLTEDGSNTKPVEWSIEGNQDTGGFVDVVKIGNDKDKEMPSLPTLNSFSADSVGSVDVTASHQGYKGTLRINVIDSDRMKPTAIRLNMPERIVNFEQYPYSVEGHFPGEAAFAHLETPYWVKLTNEMAIDSDPTSDRANRVKFFSNPKLLQTALKSNFLETVLIPSDITAYYNGLPATASAIIEVPKRCLGQVTQLHVSGPDILFRGSKGYYTVYATHQGNCRSNLTSDSSFWYEGDVQITNTSILTQTDPLFEETERRVIIEATHEGEGLQSATLIFRYYDARVEKEVQVGDLIVK